MLVKYEYVQRAYINLVTSILFWSKFTLSLAFYILRDQLLNAFFIRKNEVKIMHLPGSFMKPRVCLL